MLERQASLCKLSCFGFVNNIAHYEVYHWAKEHIERQKFKKKMEEIHDQQKITTRLWEAVHLCKTVVSWGRKYYYEVILWAKEHHIQQIAEYHRYNREMDKFHVDVINEREHEKEYQIGRAHV